MSDNHILVEQPQDYPGLQLIRFNRPEKKNAITASMYRRMASAIAQADSDPGIRVTVFLGTPGCFSAGNDMADFLAFAQSNPTEPPAAFAFLMALAGARKPLVSGVDGLAIGIGTTLNLHCDLTVASDRSLFRTPFVDLGLVPEAGSSLLVPRLMGHQRAFALLAAGEGFSAEDARAAGLIWRVVSPEAVETVTLEIAGKLAARPAAALAITRDLIRGDGDALQARMELELSHFTERLKSGEARSAFEAFLQPRRPAS